MKNLLIVFVLGLISIGAGLVYHFSNQSSDAPTTEKSSTEASLQNEVTSDSGPSGVQSTQDLSSSTTSASTDLTSTVPVFVEQSGGLLANLDANVIAVLGFTPRHLSPLLNYISAKSDYILNLELLNKLPSSSLKLPEDATNILGIPETSLQEILGLLSMASMLTEFTADITSNLLVISNKTFTVTPGLEVPFLLLNSNLANPELGQEVSLALASFIPDGKLEQETFKITKEQHGYSLLTNDKSPFKVQAHLLINDSRLQLMVGTNTEATFRSMDGSNRLVDGTRWKALKHALVLNPAWFSYLDYRNLEIMLDRYKDMLPEDSSTTYTNEVKNVLSKHDGLFYSTAFGQEENVAIEYRACSFTTSKETTDSASKVNSKLSKGLPLVFNRLVDNNTLLGFGINIAASGEYVDYVVSLMAQDQATTISPIVNQFKEILAGLDPIELSIVSQASSGLPIPEGFLLLRSASNDSTKLIDFLAKTLQKISLQFDIPDIAGTVQKNERGESIIKFADLGTGMPMSIVPVGSNSIALVSTVNLSTSIKQRLSQSNSNLLLGENNTERLNSSSSIFYINGSTITNMAKPLLPMLLAGANAGMMGDSSQDQSEITQHDIDLVLNLFKGALVVANQDEYIDSSTQCSNSVLLHIPDAN